MQRKKQSSSSKFTLFQFIEILLGTPWKIYFFSCCFLFCSVINCILRVVCKFGLSWITIFYSYSTLMDVFVSWGTGCMWSCLSTPNTFKHCPYIAWPCQLQNFPRLPRSLQGWCLLCVHPVKDINPTHHYQLRQWLWLESSPSQLHIQISRPWLEATTTDPHVWDTSSKGHDLQSNKLLREINSESVMSDVLFRTIGATLDSDVLFKIFLQPA